MTVSQFAKFDGAIGGIFHCGPDGMSENATLQVIRTHKDDTPIEKGKRPKEVKVRRVVVLCPGMLIRAANHRDPGAYLASVILHEYGHVFYPEDNKELFKKLRRCLKLEHSKFFSGGKKNQRKRSTVLYMKSHLMFGRTRQ